MPKRPCLRHGCPNYVSAPGESYCAEHQAAHGHRSPSNRVLHSTSKREWNAYRARLRRQIERGDVVLCALCGMPITETNGNQPDGLTIDHIVPIAEGGAHEPGSWQPAHRSCNRRRGGSARYRPRVQHPSQR